MPNLFAYVALLTWGLAALLFYRIFRPVTAATITLLGAVVLLPANFAVDFRGLPPIDRHVIAGIGALAGYVFLVPKRLRAPGRVAWIRYVIVIQVVCAFITAYTNPDPLHYGGMTIPGLSEYDALGVTFTRFMTIGVPFYLGSRLIRGYDDLLSILRVIVFFGLFYVPLVFWEARMSPQLHTMLYGYFPHIFAAHIRGGGFRPLVFTSSGLEAALFMSTSVIACAGLMHARVKVLGFPALVPFLLLLVALAECKSLGSFLYGILVPALLILAKPAWQARTVLLLSSIVVLYPLLRSQGLFPTQVLLESAGVVSAERESSLKTRFDNEDRLLQKARERPVFGWGTWGRNRVYNRSTGVDESITDGYWIIEMGTFGLTGFLSFFGVILAPLVLCAKRLRFLPPDARRAVVVTLVLIVMVHAVDLIPNAFSSPFTLFMAGALVPLAASRRKESGGPQATSENLARMAVQKSGGG